MTMLNNSSVRTMRRRMSSVGEAIRVNLSAAKREIKRRASSFNTMSSIGSSSSFRGALFNSNNNQEQPSPSNSPRGSTLSSLTLKQATEASEVRARLASPSFDADAPCLDSGGGRWTPLHAACSENALETVGLLLDEGNAEVDARAADGKTPLHLACCTQSWECVRVLLSNGANVEIRDRTGQYPRDLAKMFPNVPKDVVVALSGRDVKAMEASEAKRRERALKKCVTLATMNSGMMSEGLSSTSTLSSSAPLQQFPTMSMREAQDVHIVKIHVMAGAGDERRKRVAARLNQPCCDTPSWLRWTPLLSACSVPDGHDCAELLLRVGGVDVGLADLQENTPLHLAASSGSWKTSRLLVQFGADVERRNLAGKTPYDLAKAKSDAPRSILAMLAPKSSNNNNNNNAAVVASEGKTIRWE